mgnify:CR=1 FL=1
MKPQEENTNKIIELLDKEANKVTTLLSFLLDAPDLATKLSGINKEKVQIMNITRLAITEYWLQEMKIRLKKLYGDEMFNNFDRLKSFLEVEK